MTTYRLTPNIVPEFYVAAGVLSDSQGRVLIGQRTQADRYQDQWEFPGGKLEDNEDPQQALVRELGEELGIMVERSEALMQFSHCYPDRRVRLYVRRVTRYRGQPHGREGQSLRWVLPHELHGVAMLEANLRIVRTLNLPAGYAITDLQRFELRSTLNRLPGLVEAGVTLLQIREKHLSMDAYGALVGDLLPVCRRLGIRLLANVDPAWAVALGLDGVHLSSTRLAQLRARPLPRDYWVGASCHDLTQLEHAAQIGADFAVLAPVNKTPGHGDSALGWREFAALCDQARLPVYALGGVGLADLAQARRSGAQGVAMIRGAWENST